MPTCRKCQNKFKQRVVLNDKKVVLSNKRRYCLVCSPYMGRNNQKLENVAERKKGVCRICEKSSKRASCSICSSCETKIRRIRVKTAALKLLGNKCHDCHYDNDIVVLQFHHLDPNKKEFEVGSMANRKWEVIKKELKKCIILCANCHIVRHSNRNKKLLEEILKYNGRILDL